MEINPMEFGRALAALDEINRRLDKLENRVVFRLDNLEDRVEKLEQARASRKFSESAWDRLVWGLIGAGLIAGVFGLAASLGVV